MKGYGTVFVRFGSVRKQEDGSFTMRVCGSDVLKDFRGSFRIEIDLASCCEVREIVKFIPFGAVEFILTLGEFFCNYGNKRGGGRFTKSSSVVNYKIWL